MGEPAREESTGADVPRHEAPALPRSATRPGAALKVTSMGDRMPAANFSARGKVTKKRGRESLNPVMVVRRLKDGKPCHRLPVHR